MTTPPYDRSDTEPVPPTPVPAAVPEPVPAPAAFAPVEPEPVPVTAVPAPAGTRPARKASGSSRLLNVALGAALVVGVAGVAFAAGRVTAPANTGGTVVSVTDGQLPGNGVFPGGGQLPDGFEPGSGQFPGGGASGNGQGGRGFVGFAGSATIEGTVESVTEDSITVKLESGQTITVGLSSDTTYHQQADAEASDVAAGKTVIVRLGGLRTQGGGSGEGSTTTGSASDVTVVP